MKNNTYAPDNQPEYSCIYCDDNSKCTNSKCVMRGLICDGARGCKGYISVDNRDYRKAKRFRVKKWHKVKTIFDTYLPNARYY